MRRFRRPKLISQKNFQTNGFRGTPTVTVMTSWHTRKWGRSFPASYRVRDEDHDFYAVAVRFC